MLPSLGLSVVIRLEDEDVVFEVAPFGIDGRVKAREVLYPRHFILPTTSDAYTTFPFSQGSIIPGNWDGHFHHREGYAEAVAEWLGGYTGTTGYCGIAETPHDLYQAVHHEAGQAASVFFHWLGSLGELRYARVVRFRFAKGLDYVKQARHYRKYVQQVGWWRSMQDKIAENPNVSKLAGAPIVNIAICHRRERTMDYKMMAFADAAATIEQFHQTSGYANAVVHVDGWGFWGYDAMHPDVLPPNREAGGVKGLSEMAKRVKDLGYLFGLHDQYIDYYFHAPSYDQSNSIVLDNGKSVRINNWCGGPCGHLCYTQIPQYVRRNYYEGIHRSYPLNHNSPSIWDMAKPTASYLDCFCRGGVECFSKDHPMTRTENRQITNEVFQIVRNGKDGQMVVLSLRTPAGLFGTVPGFRLGHRALRRGRTQRAGHIRDQVDRYADPALAFGLPRCACACRTPAIRWRPCSMPRRPISSSAGKTSIGEIQKRSRRRRWWRPCTRTQPSPTCAITRSSATTAWCKSASTTAAWRSRSTSATALTASTTARQQRRAGSSYRVV